MKLLYLTEYFKSGYGVSLVIKEQAKRLLKDPNIEISIGACHIDNTLSSDGVQVIRLQPNKESLYNYLKDFHADIVIAHTPMFFALVSEYSDKNILKVAYDHGEPFAEFFKDNEYNERKNTEIFKLKALLDFHLHISISEFIKKTSGIADSYVIYNGCEHITTDIKVDKSGIRDLYKIPHDAFLITSLSRIGIGEAHYKGFDLLIEIKKRIKPYNQNVQFILMGKIADGGKEVSKQLENEGIIVMPNVDEITKANILAITDIFLSTSLWEGFNLPIIEAQYNAVVSISLSTGAHPEVCPLHFLTVDEMVTFIKKISRDRRLLSSYSQLCKDFVKKRFRWEANAKQFKDIITEKLELHKKNRLSPLRLREDVFDLGSEDDCSDIINKHLKRIGYNGVAERGLTRGSYIFKGLKDPTELVSIIIPNRDSANLLKTCIDSIIKKTTYNNFEIIIVENGSVDETTFHLYKHLKTDDRIKVCTWDKAFNYSAINNFAVRQSQGNFILFLNNDMEVINPDWLERLMDHAVRKDVGIVGAKLYYPNDTVQHGGVLLGVNDIACHAHRGFARDADGYFGRLKVIHNVSAVTGACMMIKRDVFYEVDGFDENLPIAFNDIDLCLKVRQKGYLIVWTPLCELYHYESITRGEEDTDEKRQRFGKEVRYFKSKWAEVLKKGDPYYNPNLTVQKEDFSIRLK